MSCNLVRHKKEPAGPFLICTTRSVRLDAVFLDDLGPGVDLLVSKDPRGCQTGAQGPFCEWTKVFADGGEPFL